MNSGLPSATSMSVDDGTSTERLADASAADQTTPARPVLSQTGGTSTAPTSLALTQPGPGRRVSPSPLYITSSQSGLLSICFRSDHCGRRVNTTASSVRPERSGVSLGFLTHCALLSDCM